MRMLTKLFLEHRVETVTISGYEFKSENKNKNKTAGEILSYVTENARRHFVAGYCSNLNSV